MLAYKGNLLRIVTGTYEFITTGTTCIKSEISSSEYVWYFTFSDLRYGRKMTFRGDTRTIRILLVNRVHSVLRRRKILRVVIPLIILFLYYVVTILY